MNIADLAALDAAERARIAAKVITDLQHAIDMRRACHGRTDALQRHLDTLTAERTTT